MAEKKGYAAKGHFRSGEGIAIKNHMGSEEMSVEGHEESLATKNGRSGERPTQDENFAPLLKKVRTIFKKDQRCCKSASGARGQRKSITFDNSWGDYFPKS